MGSAARDVAAPRQISGIWVAMLYAALAFVDLTFSLTAFSEGITEANPLLAWLIPNGLFVPMKVLLTALVSCLIAFFYSRRGVQRAIWFAVLITAAVDLYHIWGLAAVSL